MSVSQMQCPGNTGKRTQEAPGGIRARGLRLRAHLRPHRLVRGYPGGGCARAAPRVRPYGLPPPEQVISEGQALKALDVGCVI